jgi:hypothetical protein
VVVSPSMGKGGSPDPTMTQDNGTDDGEAQSDGTCDDCGLSLAEAQEQPAGYVRLTTDGERLCGACDTIRRGWERRNRKTADELAADDQDSDGAEASASASMTRTATGWVSSSRVPADENETVDETPL